MNHYTKTQIKESIQFEVSGPGLQRPHRCSDETVANEVITLFEEIYNTSATLNEPVNICISLLPTHDGFKVIETLKNGDTRECTVLVEKYPELIINEAMAIFNEAIVTINNILTPEQRNILRNKTDHED